jgi:hypothetical protein|tara:strand:+ start:4041 stop:4529 length:489 start_codon:yes stop_codon:yes gene_type:complete
MAKKRGIGNILSDTERLINDDFNIFIEMIANDLRDVSPQDTGFFASSWKASTQRPQAKDDKKDFAPWSGYKRGSRRADIKPRYKVPAFNYKKQPTVYIGNTVLYANSALASKDSDIIGYVQGEIGRLVKETFREKKAGRIFALTGQQGASPVGYTRVGENPL